MVILVVTIVFILFDSLPRKVRRLGLTCELQG